MQKRSRKISSERSGTQSIERAIVLLKKLSERSDFGWTLVDLVERCEISKSTAHRILGCLVRERLVRQRKGDGHYVPGSMLFELGLSVPGFGEFQNKARVRLAALAKDTGGLACLFFRSGDDYVCSMRVGQTRLKVFSRFQGLRRPLTSSAGGAAILFALPQAEAQSIVRRNLQLSYYTKDRARDVHSMLKRSRELGFAVSAGDIAEGINSYGLALRDASGQPFAAVMLAAEAHVLPLSRMVKVKSEMNRAVADLQTVLQGCAF